ncbi:uncharacterized protein LOC123964633 isoform X1 [Micropterus dolomieu]|uniref:uncharacterized protein LOC123964633 isoform X1 n=1 Tax=Micropterus dolomieu TaxID=147949 RepID=UPI001E8D139A|nr:uncharacterized protein LOC123964633 isoform X1 [Micropterus dolomieu]
MRSVNRGPDSALSSEDPEDTETSIMATADLLLELMFSWIQQRELCAEQLKKLARELESLREKCNVSECVGSSAAVVGAACVIGAGAVTLFTGGAAVPLLGLIGAVSSVGGVTISVVTKLTEHFLSSSTMKEAQKIEEQSNKIAERIQKLFQQLKAEVKNRSSSADPDKLDRRMMMEILTAMGRRSGLKGEINVRMCGDKPQFYFDAGPRHIGLNSMAVNPALAVGFAAILKFFAFEVSDKELKILFANGAKQLMKLLSTTGFKTALKGGAKVVGGALGLAFALPEAIDNWTDLIKNNHVTEASQSLRDTADDLLKISRTLREQFDNIKEMFDQMATSQREHEDDRQEDNNSSYSAQENSDQEDEERDREDEDSDRERDREDEDSDRERDREDEDSDREDEEDDREEETEDDESSHEAPAAIRVGLVNVRSMNNKTSRILELITQNYLDVFLTTETWLNRDTGDDVLTTASPHNFNFNHRSRATRGGGVAIQYSRYLNGEQIHFDFITTFEHVATVLQHDEWTEPVLIINVYHPPGYNLNRFRAFLDELQMLLDEVREIYNSIIVTGDFNIHVDNERRTATDEFEFFLLINDLFQHVGEPTHQAGHFLDLVLTRNVEISNLSVRNDRISDHYTVYFSARPASEDREEKTKEKADRDEPAKKKKEE